VPFTWVCSLSIPAPSQKARRQAERQQAASAQCRTHRCAASGAMLRLASLLRTDHLLGGAQSSTFITQLNRVINEIQEELSHDQA